mmetsp:Transcript_15124/g.33359  ORF Transcript_15124/g.33359 Transcript_15124/m.33359 type:complete len:218 (-) Transcript_15124:1237-1890(-)
MRRGRGGRRRTMMNFMRTFCRQERRRARRRTRKKGRRKRGAAAVAKAREMERRRARAAPRETSGAGGMRWVWCCRRTWNCGGRQTRPRTRRVKAAVVAAVAARPRVAASTRWLCVVTSCASCATTSRWRTATLPGRPTCSTRSWTAWRWRAAAWCWTYPWCPLRWTWRAGPLRTRTQPAPLVPRTPTTNPPPLWSTRCSTPRSSAAGTMTRCSGRGR